jgi:hypothetical protein
MEVLIKTPTYHGFLRMAAASVLACVLTGTGRAGTNPSGLTHDPGYSNVDANRTAVSHASVCCTHSDRDSHSGANTNNSPDNDPSSFDLADTCPVAFSAVGSLSL